MKKRRVSSAKSTGDSKRSSAGGGGQHEAEQRSKKAAPKTADAGLAKESVPYDSDDENEGFGNWLRSTDGVAYMRLFVVANSLLVVMTMSWSHLDQVLDIVRDLLGL